MCRFPILGRKYHKTVLWHCLIKIENAALQFTWQTWDNSLPHVNRFFPDMILCHQRLFVHILQMFPSERGHEIFWTFFSYISTKLGVWSQFLLQIHGKYVSDDAEFCMYAFHPESPSDFHMYEKSRDPNNPYLLLCAPCHLLASKYLGRSKLRLDFFCSCQNYYTEDIFFLG